MPKKKIKRTKMEAASKRLIGKSDYTTWVMRRPFHDRQLYGRLKKDGTLRRKVLTALRERLGDKPELRIDPDNWPQWFKLLVKYGPTILSIIVMFL